MLKKYGCFFTLVAYVIGALGGFGYTAFAKEWFIAICVAFLAAMAFPFAKKVYKELTSIEKKEVSQ